MARLNVNTLGISELKWMGMGNFDSDGVLSITAGKNPLEEMEESSSSTKESEMQFWVQS